MTISKKTPWGALPCRSESSLSRLAARRPEGGAALPRPRRFADMFWAMAARAWGSLADAPNSREITGESRLATFWARPERSMTSISPFHRQRVPPIRSISWTASLAPDSDA